MQYSCAYFHNPNIGLDQAQKDKKEHIIKKLNINENMNVLDIGCGWWYGNRNSKTNRSKS